MWANFEYGNVRNRVITTPRCEDVDHERRQRRLGTKRGRLGDHAGADHHAHQHQEEVVEGVGRAPSLRPVPSG